MYISFLAILTSTEETVYKVEYLHLKSKVLSRKMKDLFTNLKFVFVLIENDNFRKKPLTKECPSSSMFQVPRVIIGYQSHTEVHFI